MYDRCQVEEEDDVDALSLATEIQLHVSSRREEYRIRHPPKSAPQCHFWLLKVKWRRSGRGYCHFRRRRATDPPIGPWLQKVTTKGNEQGSKGGDGLLRRRCPSPFKLRYSALPLLIALTLRERKKSRRVVSLRPIGRSTTKNPSADPRIAVAPSPCRRFPFTSPTGPISLQSLVPSSFRSCSASSQLTALPPLPTWPLQPSRPIGPKKNQSGKI